MTHIRFISATDTYAIRQQILRPTQSIEECHYVGDSDDSSFHIGVFEGEVLISIGSFYQEAQPGLNGYLPYRLRGMATLTDYRGKGIGKQLIEHSEKVLKEKGCELWWCNARISAGPYYEKLGLTQLGDVFEIEPIGPHVIMYKQI
ncbi:GNAT family N-acetyltransferase [Bacillus sp. CH30_1T]|uniref:GNAT family N-acetyltransferase n=1 Tax=Bacillus sp. CH30_1T TaxID=2604836 RepID=UPI0011ECA55B|nr:GNAT family N-acetyltransferase [Bacillus sp. CH30_1T]KAA0562536.1 GNAT family N-acetyltransferase [Bacillus sp. CH30_1T]